MPKTKAYRSALKHGYRSGLEKTISLFLSDNKYTFDYETIKIEWEDLCYRTYTPDFILHNGIIVETKGFFDASDRKKHLLIKEQYPMFDIRFIFSNSKSKFYKGAKGTYGDWCNKYGFKYADKLVPKEWLNENTSNNTRPTRSS